MRSEMPCTMSRLCSMMQIVTPARHLRAQQRQETFVRTGVEPRRRLVEQPQPRAAGQMRARPTGICARRRRDRARACRASASSDGFERGFGARLPFARAGGAAGLPQPRTALGHRRARSRARSCGRTASGPGTCGRCPARAIFQCGRPRMLTGRATSRRRVRREVPGDQVEQRRLAGTVGADQRGDDARRAARATRRRPPSGRRSLADRLRACEQHSPSVSRSSRLGLARRRKPHTPPGRKIISSTIASAVDDLLDRADLGARQIRQVADSAAGNSRISNVPTIGPISVAVPPMITIAISSTEVSSVKLSTLMKLSRTHRARRPLRPATTTPRPRSS